MSGSTRQKDKLMFYVDFPTKEIKSMITERYANEILTSISEFLLNSLKFEELEETTGRKDTKDSIQQRVSIPGDSS